MSAKGSILTALPQQLPFFMVTIISICFPHIFNLFLVLVKYILSYQAHLHWNLPFFVMCFGVL